MVSQGCIKPLCDLLAVADTKIIEVTLDSLENILKMGEMDKEARGTGVNENALFIEEAGGMEKILNVKIMLMKRFIKKLTILLRNILVMKKMIILKMKI